MHQNVLVVVLDPEAPTLGPTLDAIERRGLVPLLFGPSYDSAFALKIAGRSIAYPMDYLGSGDIDTIYQAAFDWQKRMSSTRLDGVGTLDQWGVNAGVPTALWSWLPKFYPHVHLRIRLIETMRAVLAAETPNAFAIVGEDSAFPWQSPVIRRAIETFAAGIPDLSVSGELARSLQVTVEKPRIACPVGSIGSWKRPEWTVFFVRGV